jgi:hypothetical protein
MTVLRYLMTEIFAVPEKIFNPGNSQRNPFYPENPRLPRKPQKML